MVSKCKAIGLFFGLVVVGLLFTLLIGAIFVKNTKNPWDEAIPNPQDAWTVDSERQMQRAQRLSSALRIQTISWSAQNQNLTAFKQLHKLIRESYPLIHGSPFVHVTTVNEYSLLYEIQGTANGDLLPYMLAGHLDVVPASESWTVDPFGGTIQDGVIYGRGTLDDKGAVFGILEALEFLLEKGFVPERTFYVAFGHDEEVDGFEGAGKIAETLQKRGVNEVDFVLDEAFGVMRNIVPGVAKDVAVIGVTEKGYASLELSVTRAGGHSSIPPRESSLGILARAVGRLEENRQPSSFGLGPEIDLFTYLAPYADFVHRLLFANLWLLSPGLQYVLSLDPKSDSLQRTTTAITIFKSGYKSNVVPGVAIATVNHRIHPSVTLEEVLEHDRKILNDPRINITVKSSYPPTPIAPYGSDVPQFNLIAETIKNVFPESVIAPAYPLIHGSPFVHVTTVNEYSLLYEIQGTANGDLLPYVLASHLDVVPASESWTVEPFGGAIQDGVIYGRGTLDNKGTAFGILEALEFLLEKGFVPARTFYIAFGHDEELNGFEGAGKIAETLQDRGVNEVDFILDEGFGVMRNFVPGIPSDVAIIGVTEKGYATLELSVTGAGGHSSIPPRESSLGILARAVGRQEENLQPSLFGLGPEIDLFIYLAPHADFVHRLLFANLWLLSPVLQYLLSLDPKSDSMTRTTTAVTIFKSGYKSNVVPGVATATVNHRVHPSMTLEEVLEHDRKILNDPRINITVKSSCPPTPIAPYGPDVPQFTLIAETIKNIFPDTVVAPVTTVVNTDLRRYVPMTKRLYRFAPWLLTGKIIGTIHGDDEHIGVSDFNRAATFYARLIVNAQKEGTGLKLKSSRESEL